MMCELTDVVDQISKQVTELQKTCITSQEAASNAERQHGKIIDALLLQLIDVLDLIEIFKKNTVLYTENKNHCLLLKIEKRLEQVLARLNVHEIVFPDHKILPGIARVLESQASCDGLTSGMIIDICRRGYQRGDKVIRPADVITAQ